MFLYKHPNGIWYIHYDDSSGRHLKKSTRCSLKGDALKFVKTWESQSQQDQENTRKIRLSEFRDRYLIHAENRFVSKSVRGIRKVLDDMTEALGNPIMKSISVLQVAQFIDARHAQVSLWSARHYYGMLAAAFETAVRWDILTVNPFRKVKKPKPPPMLPVFFSRTEFQACLSVIDKQIIRDISVFAVLTCMRLNEIIFLEWDDVDLSNRLIHIRNKETFKTKTKQNRTIPMHESVAELLTGFTRSGTHVFTDISGQRLKDQFVTKQVKRAIKKSGVNPKLHFHSFRHTGATWMVQAGVSIYTVSKILGHSSVQTTQIYAHWSPDQFHSAVNAMSL